MVFGQGNGNMRGRRSWRREWEWEVEEDGLDARGEGGGGGGAEKWRAGLTWTAYRVFQRHQGKEVRMQGDKGGGEEDEEGVR
jgi:hypothetical protein